MTLKISTAMEKRKTEAMMTPFTLTASSLKSCSIFSGIPCSLIHCIFMTRFLHDLKYDSTGNHPARRLRRPHISVFQYDNNKFRRGFQDYC